MAKNELSVEYRGNTYESLDRVPGIPTVRTTKSFVARLPRREIGIPPVVKRQFDDLVFLSYRGATLPPSIETYHHSRNIAQVIAEMVEDGLSPKPVTVVDIGTGSGIIAITIADRLRPHLQNNGSSPVRIVATDILGRALEVAGTNARLNDVNQIMLRQRDGLDGLVTEFGKMDAIISNPPFFPTHQINPRYRRVDFIPMEAIDGGIDTLKVYRKFFSQGGTTLSDAGFMFVEHMTYQKDMIASLAIRHMPSAAILAINGARHGYTATAVGNPDTLRLVQNYSGGKFI